MNMSSFQDLFLWTIQILASEQSLQAEHSAFILAYQEEHLTKRKKIQTENKDILYRSGMNFNLKQY